MASTAHQDFKGHHPEIRPHIPHRRKEVNKVTIAGEEIVYGEAGIGYVDTSGYGMLQANDAEPPPKNGILRKALQCAAVFFLSLMVLIGPTSCNKDPQPTPVGPTPIDTITPVNPGDTITPVNPGDTITPTPGTDTIIPEPGGDTIVPPTPGGDTLQPGAYDTIPGRTVVFKVVHAGHDGIIYYPTMDTIRYYANHPGCDTIYIKWYIPPNYTVQWTPGVFHVAFDSLEQRFDLTDKCRGARDIVVSKNYGGASIPDAELLTHSKYGMTVSDSIRCTNWGYHVRRSQNAKSYNPYDGNRVPRAGRSH